jgi:hypothetical protein
MDAIFAATSCKQDTCAPVIAYSLQVFFVVKHLVASTLGVTQQTHFCIFNSHLMFFAIQTKRTTSSITI